MDHKEAQEAQKAQKTTGGLRRRLFFLCILCLFVPLVFGSAAGQTPTTFRGADPNAVVDQTSIGDLKWFEVFKDPELQKLVRTALVQNYDLRAAVVRVDAARANLGLARSEQFPQFEASADLTSTRTSRNGQIAIPGQSGRSRSFGSVLLNLLTFELDVWGRLRA
jgi:outer membrane protein TolC